MKHIILTPEQAIQVSGESTAGNMIMPVLIKDGTYILPASVLEDKEHLAKKDFLSALPTRMISDDDLIRTSLE